MGNSSSSGLSKSCLANFTIPVQNQDPDLIPDAYIGSALKQCSTSSFGFLTNIANRTGLLPNNKTTTGGVTTGGVTTGGVMPNTNIVPTVPVQNPPLENFLGVTQSTDNSSLCVSYMALFWLAIILLIIALIYKPHYLGIKGNLF